MRFYAKTEEPLPEPRFITGVLCKPDAERRWCRHCQRNTVPMRATIRIMGIERIVAHCHDCDRWMYSYKLVKEKRT